MSELKPCPFCGGEAEYKATFCNCRGVLLDPGMYHFVACKNRCVTRLFVRGTSKEEAIKAWNTRPNPWHTGTPTEEGWYLLHLRRKDKPYCVAYMDGHHWLSINDFFILVDDVLAWQKIEPYRG